MKACFVVPIYDNEIMLQHRPDKTFGLFGGHQRMGETSLACVCREFKEETGMRTPSRLKQIMRNGPYTIYSFRAPRKFSRISNNSETIGHIWIEPMYLNRKKLEPKFKQYSNKFINIMEDVMGKKSIAVTASDAIETISILKAQGRTDLATEFAKEVFGGKAVAQETAVLDDASVGILDEKAKTCLENLMKAVEKEAEGSQIEVDILKKHVLKKLKEALEAKPVEPAETTEPAPATDVEEVGDEEEGDEAKIE